MSNFSSNLIRLLEQNNLTISQLASEIKITVSTLSKLVNGKIEDPRATTLKQIAKYFKISIDELLGVNFSNNQILVNQSSNVPVYKLNQLNELDKFPATNQYKKIDIVKSEDYFIVYIDSPAMYPLFDINTMILFKKTNKPENLQYVLCKIHDTGEIILRQIMIDSYTRVLKPLNNDFKCIEIEKLDEVIAVAIQFQRELM